MLWMRYPFFGYMMPCHWGFGSHCFETLKWSHLKGLRGPRRPFDMVSHPRRMDAGYYSLFFQNVKLIWENIHTSGVGVLSVFG